MFGYRLRVYIWAAIAISLALFLTFFANVPDYIENNGKPPSWSQNALFAFHFLLNFLLIAISKNFSELAAHHEFKEKEMFKWLSKSIKFEHLARFTDYSFLAILIFHLESEVIPEWMHMVATGLGVLGLFLLVIGWFKMWTIDWWVYVISISVAVLLLILAFGFKLFEVGYGEFALALVGIVFIFKIIKQKNLELWTL